MLSMGLTGVPFGKRAEFFRQPHLMLSSRASVGDEGSATVIKSMREIFPLRVRKDQEKRCSACRQFCILNFEF